MRILYHHRTLADGAEGIHIREMVNAFRELGHTVQIVALIGEDNQTNHQVEKSNRRGAWSMVSELLPGAAYECAEIGYNFIGRRTIDRVIKELCPDFIYDRYNSYCTVAVRSGKKFGIPVFLEVNAPLAYERSIYERRTLRLPTLAQRYERFICNSADHVFAVSTPLKNFLVSQHDVPTSQITVLPNGVNIANFDASVSGRKIRDRIGVGDERVIGFVGILRPWHGLDMLLRVFAAIASDVESVHLLIVGDGPMESELKDLACHLGVMDQVSFTGRIPHHEMTEHIAAMDIAVSPKATFYASPMKILEYMAMGIATVAPNTANIRDVLTDGENCQLFANDDEEALRSAIQSLIENPKEAERLGKNALQRAESQLSWKNVAQVILDHRQKFGQ